MRTVRLVAPFVNRTGDPAFDEVLELALERELVNSKFVNVVPRPRIEDVLALMKRPPDTRLDDALAREVAVRDGGIRALLTGRINRIGADYVLTTSIVDPLDGQTLATISHNAEQSSDLLAAIRAQALDVRRVLGEASAGKERQVAERDAAQAELAKKRAARDALVLDIPTNALSLYDRLRQRVSDGIPVSEVIQSRCSACKDNIPSTDVQRAKVGEIVQCSSCYRILHVR